MADLQSPAGDDYPVSDHGLSRAELQDRAVQGALWTLLHTLLGVPIAFVVNIVIARVLGVVDYGRLAYLSTIMDVVGGIISLGIGTGLIQFASKAHAAGRTHEVVGLLRKTQGFRVLVTGPILSVVVLVIANVDPWLVAAALLFGIAIPSFFGGAPACFAVENKTATGAQNAMVINIVTQALVLLAALALGTADAIWVTRLAMGGIAVAVAMFFIAPAYRRAIIRPTLPLGFPAGFWRFALPAGFAGVLASLVTSRTEVLALTWLNQPAAVGVFALAFGLVGHLLGPAQSLLGPLVPAVSGLHEVDPDAVGRAFARTLRASSTIVAILTAAALPALAFLVPLIYGAEFEEVPPVLLALGIAGGLMVVAGPAQAFLQARLRGGRLLVINIIALVVNVLLMVLFIPPFGVWGAVVANVGASATQVGMLVIGEVRAIGLSWSRALASGLPTVLGAAVSVSVWMAVGALGLAHLLAAFAAGVLGLVGVTLLLWVTRSGLSAGDTAAISRVLPGWLARLASPWLALCTRASIVD